LGRADPRGAEPRTGPCAWVRPGPPGPRRASAGPRTGVPTKRSVSDSDHNSLGNTGEWARSPDRGICYRTKSCYRLNSPVAGASPVASGRAFSCPEAASGDAFRGLAAPRAPIPSVGPAGAISRRPATAGRGSRCARRSHDGHHRGPNPPSPRPAGGRRRARRRSRRRPGAVRPRGPGPDRPTADGASPGLTCVRRGRSFEHSPLPGRGDGDTAGPAGKPPAWVGHTYPGDLVRVAVRGLRIPARTSAHTSVPAALRHCGTPPQRHSVTAPRHHCAGP
jgi:hypothetical protein